MIQGDFTHCKTLEEFYTEISKTHQKAHGKEYIAHHWKMMEVLPFCETYRELGVMQGATAACAVVAGISDIHLIDIDISRFLPYVSLFQNVDMLVTECNDLEVPDLYQVDFLLIDSLHTYKHVKAQLEVHSKFVKKYIMFHDTAAQKGVKLAVDEFLRANEDWKLIVHYPQNVGYSLIERK